MPFGLASAPATFMRLMDRVLLGADEYAHAYFDDTSVFSHNWKAHIADNADFKSLNDFSQASLHSTMVALPFFVKSVKGSANSEKFLICLR
jgi:predicted HD phosphohydrolase